MTGGRSLKRTACITDGSFSVTRWTISSREAILHRSVFIIYSVIFWFDRAEDVEATGSRDLALLFLWSCVTHCVGGCLRWSYCKKTGCPTDSLRSTSILMKTKALFRSTWLETLRNDTFVCFFSVLCVSFTVSPFPLFFAQKQTGGVVASPTPCLSL